MSSFNSLFWKEFHELRWRVAFGVVTIAGFAAIGLRARFAADMEIVAFPCLFGAFLFPLFLCMGSIAEDREDGSSRFLSSLPVSPGRILSAKFLSASLAVAIPLVVTWFIAVLLAGGRETSVFHISRSFVCALLSGLACSLWYFTFGIRQPTQWRVGMVGIALMLAWFPMGSLVEAFGGSNIAHGPMPYLFLAFLTSSIGAYWSMLFVQILTLAFLGWWLTNRFSAETRRTR